MKTLTILRHAKSSWSDAGLSDFERPLNRRGERDAPRIGERMAAAGLRPALILSSPAERAITTARIVADKLNYPREFLEKEPALYHASLDTLLDVVVAQEDRINNLMLVGHNPGLTLLANHLLPGIMDNLPTAGTLTVEINSLDWTVYSRPDATLVRFDYPKKFGAN